MLIRFEEKPEGEIILLRLYGTLPEVRVPEKIDGKPVTGLAPYAFSEKEAAGAGDDVVCVDSADIREGPARDQLEKELGEVSRLASPDGLLAAGLITPLAGDFITSVFLPDSLKTIGELCFYQCRKLKKLSFGSGDIEIGSDAFMNCKSLSLIELRATSEQPTSLRRILAQRTGETDVWFRDAAVHFPEYSEKYDLIGPAHIFELNIEGEGFRARKCFEGDCFSLSMYDEVFRRAMEKEDERTLCRMAALRLCRPASMCSHEGRDNPAGSKGSKELVRAPSSENSDGYRTYLLAHMEAFLDELIRQHDLSVFLELGRQGMLEKDHINLCLKKLTAARWVEGTRQVLGII